MMTDKINAELTLAAMETQGMIEPCDENNCHPLDWMEVVNVDIFDEIYSWNPEEAY